MREIHTTAGYKMKISIAFMYIAQLERILRHTHVWNDTWCAHTYMCVRIPVCIKLERESVIVLA